MLELKNISFSARGESNDVEILRNIDLTIPNGRFIVITGPNGGGKSTLAKVIMGIEKPTEGRILLDGEDITDLGVTERAKRGISYGFQAPPRFKGMKVSDLLSCAAGRTLSHNDGCRYLTQVGLCSREYIDRDVDSSLSGGELKRIEIATILAKGGKVFLAPDATPEALPRSIKTQFSTDFWSVCTFPSQAGGMGQLIDDSHPIFRDFPTDSHTDWQWWPMAVQRAVILPRPIRAIVAEMDSYAFLRPMAKLFECRCGGGRLLFSAFGLHGLLLHPEAKSLLRSIYRYMDSPEFQPEETFSPEEIVRLLP